MPSAIREQIMQDLAARLKLTKANGATQDVVRVERGQPNEAAVKSQAQPAVWLYGGAEAKTIVEDGGPVGAQWNELELNVVFLVRAKGRTEQIGIEFSADIEQALVTPNTRLIGGVPVDVTAQGNLVLVGTPDDEQAGGHAQFVVRYPTRLGDPRTP